MVPIVYVAYNDKIEPVGDVYLFSQWSGLPNPDEDDRMTGVIASRVDLEFPGRLGQVYIFFPRSVSSVKNHNAIMDNV